MAGIDWWMVCYNDHKRCPNMVRKDWETEYPAIDVAYDAILSSYELLVNRFEAVNGRLQNVIGWALAITSAIPLFAKSIFDNITFSSTWFIFAILFFLVLVFIGIKGYTLGGIKLIDPSQIFNEYLANTPVEFKKNMIYWAGEHFKANADIIASKSKYLSGVIVFLALEIASLWIWILTNT
ncbi:MAG: hypothetical protein TUN42_09570 [Dehalogenimonas sp.]